jgi:hypothetical protein
MSKMSGENASQLAINLIEEQLQTLPVAISMIWQAPNAGNVDTEMMAKVMQRKQRSAKTGSVGNIVGASALADPGLDFQDLNQAFRDDPLQQMRYLRVVVSNALLAVGAFFRSHGMASLRTPEVQFLGHVCDAIMNENIFHIEDGYIPIATFDGLVIDSKLNGTLLFGDGVTQGFMEFGDAIVLLRSLSRYLRGEKNFISGGDAG